MVYFHPNCISRLKHFGRCFPTGSGEAASDDPFCYSLQLPLQKAFSNGNVVCPHSSSHFNYCWIKKKNPIWVFSHQLQGGSRATCFLCGQARPPALRNPATDCPKPCSCHPPSLTPDCPRKVRTSPFPFHSHSIKCGKPVFSPTF